MEAAGITPTTVYTGDTFEKICRELGCFPKGARIELERQIAYGDDCFLGEPSAYSASQARELLRPERRREAASAFLSVCREMACRLPDHLGRICTEPNQAWEATYMRDLVGAIEQAMAESATAAGAVAAATRVCASVQDALEFAHHTSGTGEPSLLVVYGVERIGKSKAAERWAATHPDKARLVSLTAGTTDLLFYAEIATAIGCGEVAGLSAGELRRAIRETLASRDLMVIFDEAHCLFGLSAKASIKRLEYVRTELVNSGIPVALIVTPQFADRLMGLERSTDFNLNQFRGRITDWVELPSAPALADIETIAKFHLPDLEDDSLRLLVSSAVASPFPLASLHSSIVRVRALAEKVGTPACSFDLVRKAVSAALYTTDRLIKTMPAQARENRRRARRPIADPSAIARGHQSSDGSAVDRRSAATPLQGCGPFPAKPEHAAGTGVSRATTSSAFGLPGVRDRTGILQPNRVDAGSLCPDE